MLSALESLWTSFLGFSPKLILGGGMFAAFWIGGLLLNQFLLRVGRLKQLDDNLAAFLGRAAKTAMLLFGAVTALGTIGVDVGALIAALGLTGFAIGLAFKDIVSNALSGILIIIYKPFEQGDQIKVSSFAGIVRSIDLRYTILSSDGDRVFVPNSLLFSNAITVESQQTAQTT